MELHEYQVKSLLSRYGVKSPPHTLLEIGCDLTLSLSAYGFEPLAIKAQVHGSGRKEGGGERFTGRPQELADAVKSMLGAKIVTALSGPDGFLASKVMIMAVPTIAKQFQLKIWIDPSGDVVVSACQLGKKEHSERPFEGYVRPFQLNRLTASLEIRGEKAALFKKVLEGSLRVFFHFDALSLELNPLVLTEDGLFQALDAQITIDDRALYRQPELKHMVDPSQVGPKIKAPPRILFDAGGSIACVANGIGLALSSADLICQWGGIPGSVVDIGSDLTEKNLVDGVFLSRQRGAKIVFINLFSGLLDGGVPAKALKRECSEIPMVLRLEGTNASGARRLLKESLPSCVATESLDEAAKIAVAFDTSSKHA